MLDDLSDRQIAACIQRFSDILDGFYDEDETACLQEQQEKDCDDDLYHFGRKELIEDLRCIYSELFEKILSEI